MPIHKKFDITFFKKWSPEMAYVLGFIFADGNIIKTKRGTHFVSIYTSDEDLIISIRNCLKSDHKISARGSLGGVVYRIQIGSAELFHDLMKYGLTPNKSKRMELPVIPEKYIGDFIRGYFDGDGNVWTGSINKQRKNSTNVIFASFTCASHGFLLSLHRVLMKKGIKGGSLFVIKSKKCSRLSFSTLDALKLFTIMYTMSHRPFLPRKKLVFENYIKCARSSAG